MEHVTILVLYYFFSCIELQSYIYYIHTHITVDLCEIPHFSMNRGPLLSPGPQMAWCPKISRALEDGPTWPTMEQCPGIV